MAREKSTSSTAQFFSAVKHGDLELVRYLVEVEGVEVQQRDEWDATPLFYASLTGQTPLVTYLLESGAQCQEKTFDGERCLYAALNSATRQALLDANFRRAGARRKDAFLLFVEHLFDNADAYPDIELGGLHAHCFLLDARCPGLGNLLEVRRAGGSDAEPLRLDEEVLSELVRWAYTGHFNVARDHVSSGYVSRLLVDIPFKVTSSEGAYGSAEPDLEALSMDLREALSRVAENCKGPSGRFSDITLQAEGQYFHVHKAVLANRSDYFATMFSGPFLEGQSGGNLPPVVSLKDTPAFALEAALRWAYSDELGPLDDLDDLLAVMQVADWALMEGLAARVALLLHPHVTPATALPLLEGALRAGPGAERLAVACTRCIAQHLHQLVDDPLLSHLVSESAQTVAERQDVDSVPLLDDIRFYIAQIHGDGDLSDDELDDDGNLLATDWGSLSERQQKLVLLERLLATLGLEG